ncbi:LysR family transcriptional regulator [Streptomyces sp. NPDC002667]|uniref:LysR family transcriptional regulator n=1 Tax=Streptomyces sp. NPDC002667 TaxID=3364657 RepID=UPI0036C1656D
MRGAAQSCYVSQPVLSAAIAGPERELNVTLIDRGHAYQGLTPEGQRLVVEALDSGGPALVDCAVDPCAGAESGHIAHLNPQGITAGTVGPATK